MKYKVGDRVKIKTWEEMEKEHGGIRYHVICCQIAYRSEMERELVNLNCNRILTIRKIAEVIADYYCMEGLGYYWSDDMIECLASDYAEKVSKPILNRYEILDLRGHL